MTYCCPHCGAISWSGRVECLYYNKSSILWL